MKVFTDIFTRDELFSDSFPHTLEYEGVFWNVSSKLMKKDTDTEEMWDLDTYETLENKSETVDTVDKIVDSFHLEEMQGISKVKQLVDAVTPYLTKLREKLQKDKPERLEVFNAQVKKFLTEQVAKDIGNYKFYLGESCDADKSMVIFQQYNDDGKTTQIYFFVDGLKEVKM